MPFEVDPSYVEVAQRLADLFEKYPDASLRGSWQVIDVAGVTHIAYTAECFRSEGDSAPGIGCAWEQVPGKTPYTRGSELQNAETSAWGRAIVAVGASQSKRIASADEIRSARANHSPGAAERPTEGAPTPTAPGATFKSKRAKLRSRCIDLGTGMEQQISDERIKRGLPLVKDCNEEQLALFATMLDEIEAELERPFVTETAAV